MNIFTDTMTVYNHILTDDTDSWVRTVIKGVQWKQQRMISVSGGVQTEKLVHSITVDMNNDYGNSKYVDPVAYDALADKTGYWTLNDVSGEDIVVYGESATEITTSPSQLSGKYWTMGTVQEVRNNTNRRFLKNIKVVAA